MAGGLACLDATGDLNRTREEQKLFGECCFTGVRVGNNGERSASRDFSLNTHDGEFYRLNRSACVRANYLLKRAGRRGRFAWLGLLGPEPLRTGPPVPERVGVWPVGALRPLP